MAIISISGFGNGQSHRYDVDHNPGHIATDCPKDSVVVYEEKWYRKTSGGYNTDVTRMRLDDPEFLEFMFRTIF